MAPLRLSMIELSASSTPSWCADLLDRMSLGLWVADAEGRAVHHNRRAAELWGCAPLSGSLYAGYGESHTFLDEAGQPAPPEETPTAQALRSGEAVPPMSSRLQRADGTQVFLTIRVDLLTDEDGAVTGAITTLEETPDTSLEAEQALREALKNHETLFQQFASHVQDVIWIMDPLKPRLVYVSPAWEKIWGRPITDLYERPSLWMESLHPVDRPEVIDAIRGKYGKTHLVREYRIIRPDGEMRRIRDRSYPIYDDNGQIYRVCGLAEDITERKRREEELMTVLRRARCLLWHGDIRNTDTDQIWDIEYFNPEMAQQILPLEVQEGQTYSNALVAAKHPDDHQRSHFLAQDALKTGESHYTQEFRCRNRYGEEQWLSEEMTLVRVSPRHWKAVSVSLEITDTKRAEQALQRNETLYRTLIEDSSDIVAVVSPEGRILYASPSTSRILGYNETELVGATLSDILHPDERAELSQIVHDSAMNQEPYTPVLARLRHRTGEWRVLEVLSHPAPTEVWGPGLILHARDVTEQQRAHKLLAKRAEQQAAVAELGRRALADSDSDALMRDACAVVTRLLNVEIAGVIQAQEDGESLVLRAGSGWKSETYSTPFNVVPRSTMSGYSLATRQPVIVSDWRSEIRFPYHSNLRDHEIQSGMAVLISGPTEDGNAWGSLSIFHQQPCEFTQGDLHFLQTVANVLATALHRNRQEEALRRSESRFRRLVEGNIIGIIEVAPDGTLVSANDAFLLMLGYTREEWMRQPHSWQELTPPDQMERDERAVVTLQNEGNVAPYEKEFLHRDGSRIPVMIGSSLLEEEGAGGLAFVLDLSPQKRLEAQLHQGQKMEALGRLSGGIAHDFNNLLTVINGLSDTLLRNAGPDAKGLRKLQLIHDAGERAADLTRQLLAFSRYQVVQAQQVDLNQIVQTTDRFLRRIIGEDIELVYHLNADPTFLMGDPTQLEQMVMNLCVNARDAMPSGGTLTVSTHYFEGIPPSSKVSAAPEGVYGVLEVADTGVGIPSDALSHIFEPFYTTRGGVGKGTGLGLATVYGIAQQMNGAVEVSSVVGQGSTFRVYLPHHPLSTPSTELAPTPEHLPRGVETVLLVEDEDPVREFINETLRESGYNVLMASNGEEALNVSQKYAGPIHLLLTDVVMPRMGGPELATRLKQERPDARVLLMSGYTDDGQAHREVQDATWAFIQKPFSITQFGAKVREALEGSVTPQT